MNDLLSIITFVDKDNIDNGRYISNQIKHNNDNLQLWSINGHSRMLDFINRALTLDDYMTCYYFFINNENYFIVNNENELLTILYNDWIRIIEPPPDDVNSLTSWYKREKLKLKGFTSHDIIPNNQIMIDVERNFISVKIYYQNLME